MQTYSVELFYRSVAMSYATLGDRHTCEATRWLMWVFG